MPTVVVPQGSPYNNTNPLTIKATKTGPVSLSFDPLPSIKASGDAIAATPTPIPLDVAPLTDDQIRAHSLLGQTDTSGFPNLAKTQDLGADELDELIKFVGNMLGGGLITGTALYPKKGDDDTQISIDGMMWLPNFTGWNWLVRNSSSAQLKTGAGQLLQYANELKKIERRVGDHASLRRLAQGLADQVKGLNPGEFQVLPGGWRNIGGGSGHAVIYEIYRANDGTYDISICTSTGFNLADEVNIGDKRRIKPVVQFKGVTEAEILFNGDGITRPGFFQSLIELKALSSWDNNFIVDEEDILEIFDEIAHRYVPSSLSDYGAITGQRAGTCLPSSTKCWVRKRLGSGDAYKQEIFQIKQELLLVAYDKLKGEIENDTDRGALSRRLLEQAARKLLRRTAKLRERSGEGALIDDAAALKAVATAYDVIQKIEALNKRIEADRQKLMQGKGGVLNMRDEADRRITMQNSIPVLGYDVDQSRGRRRRAALEQIRKKAEKGPTRSKVLPLVETIKEDGSNLESILYKASTACVDDKLTLRARAALVHAVIDQLPLPAIDSGVSAPLEGYWTDQIKSSFWDQLPPDQINRVLSYLNNIAQYYQNAGGHELRTRELTTILSIHALTHYLALKADRQRNFADPSGRLESYKVPYAGKELNGVDALVFLDRREHQRLCAVNDYFARFNAQAPYEALFANENSTEIVKTSVHKRLANGQFWEALYKQDHALCEVIDKAAEQNSSTCDLTDAFIQQDYDRQLAIQNRYQNSLQAWVAAQEKGNNSLPHPGKPPSAPQRMVNLPREQKRVMTLERISGENEFGGQNVLSAAGYEHIIRLKQMNFWSVEACRSNKIRNGVPKCTLERPSYYKTSAYTQQFGSTPVREPNWESTASPFGPLANADKKSWETLATSRRTKDWHKPSAEWRALSEECHDPFTKKLLRPVAQWKLKPHQLVFEAGKELDRLKETSTRNLFFRLFFSSPVSKDKPLLGAGELLAQDDALVDACRDFIQRGIDHYDPKNRKGAATAAEALAGAGFFFEFSFYLAKYLNDAGQGEKAKLFCLTDELNRWLAFPDLTQEQREVLHSHRLLSYSQHQNGALSPAQIAEAYQSWCFMNLVHTPVYGQLGGYSRPQNDTLRIFAETFVEDLTAALTPPGDAAPAAIQEIGASLLEFVGVDSSDTIFWGVDKTLGYPFIAATLCDGRQCQIDLVAGKIYVQGIPLVPFQGSKLWEKEADFLHIFKGATGYQYQRVGEREYAFNHPSMGAVRLEYDSAAKKHRIYRKFKDSDAWHVYVPPAMSKGFGVPSVLTWDHDHWIPATPDTAPHSGLIISTKTDQIEYVVLSQDGRIAKADDLGRPDARQLYFEGLGDLGQSTRLRLFDPHALLALDDRDQTQEIRFPRYTSLEGNPLLFIKSDIHFVWNDNRQYILPEKMPLGHFGTIPNYLFLQSVDKTKPNKLLVPFQTLITEKLAYANGKLHVDPAAAKTGEWGSRSYFTYDLGKGNTVTANSREGELFLAYLHISQKKYAEAVALLKKGAAGDPISDVSMQILEMIATIPTLEDHPDLVAVKLQALLLQSREKDRRADAPVEEYFDKTDTGYALLYNTLIGSDNLIGSLNNVSSGCRLTHAEELELLQILVREGVKKAGNIFELFKEVKQKNYLDMLDRLRRRISSLESGHKPSGASLASKGERKLPQSRHGRNRSDFKYISSRVYPPPKRKYCDSDADFQKALENNRSNWIRETAWLSNPGDHSLYTRAYKDPNTPNGELFQHVCHIAKHGTPAERQEMLFKLRLWRLHSNVDQSNYLRLSASEALDLMIVMLLRPEKFPDITTFNMRTLEGKGEFLTKVFDGYDYVCASENKFIQKVSYSNAPGGNALPSGPYPIPTRSAFDNPPTPATLAGSPVEVDLASNNERWAQLAEWEKYLVITHKAKVEGDSDFRMQYEEEMLSETEKDMAANFKRDIAKLQEDFNAGKGINLQAADVSITAEQCQALSREVDGTIAAVSETLDGQLTAVLALLNRGDIDQQKHLNAIAKLGGGVIQRLTFEDAVAALLTLDTGDFRAKNPHLDDQDIAQLAQMTLQAVDLKSHLAQLRHIAKLLKDISREPEQSAVRAHYCQELYGAMQARYHFEGFDMETQVALRIFSGQSGLIPHKKQTDLIRQMSELDQNDPARFKDIVIQLIMGGGKTSVLATILMYLSSKRKGRIGLMVVPSSLYDTVKVNLGNRCREAYGIDLRGIDLSREEMTVYNLEKLKKLLDDAEKSPIPLIAKASSLQALELEALSQARLLRTNYVEVAKAEAKLADVQRNIRFELSRNTYRMSAVEQARSQDRCNSLAATQQMLTTYIADLNNAGTQIDTKLRLLSEITLKLPEKADALLDEVDLLLDALQMVNFPDGERVHVCEKGNQLLHLIYKGLVSRTLKIPTLDGVPSVDDVVRLSQANNPNDEEDKIDTALYLKHVVPVLAELVANEFEPIQDYIADYQSSYMRFVTGKMAVFLEHFVAQDSEPLTEKALDQLEPDWKTLWKFDELQTDLQFLRRLKALYESEEAEEKEAAQLIARTKHFLVELTPETLKKGGKRDFGPKPGSEGKIIPYIAAHAPATTEFGYHWEEACYYYQWAAAFPLEEAQVLDMARSFTEMARYYIQKNGEAFEETIEYKTFFKLFGVPLDKVREEGMAAKAVENVGSNIALKLELQYENIAANVTYNTERLSSNGANLTSQCSSRRAMSATPRNVDGYIRPLANRYLPDVGTEGRILHALVTKEKKGQVHTAKLSTVDDFLGSIFKGHPSPKRIRGIIEEGGLFKAFKTNSDVAREILNFFETTGVNNDIEGVLFFNNAPGKTECDTLYVWKRGAVSPEMVGGTAPGDLAAKNLVPENYFVFYDERHTTGQDIKQTPDAINIVTFDEHVFRRTFTQGIMRLRQFLSKQEVEIATPANTRKMLINGGKGFKDFILQSEKAQSMQNAAQMVPHFQQQIGDITRRPAVRAVLLEALNPKRSRNAFIKAVEENEPFFVTKMHDDSYLQFGRLRTKVDTKEYLKKGLNAAAKNFAATQRGHAAAVEDDADEMAGHIAKASCLPAQWEEVPDTLGVQQEIEVQQQVQVRQQVQQKLELETEVQLELKRYDQMRASDPLIESKMKLDAFTAILRDLKSDKPAAHSLREQLRAFEYGFDNERICYEDAFSGSIYGTHAYFHTCKSILPFFHKMQRPPKQILAVKTDRGMRWLLLSEREAKYAKVHLKTLHQQRSPLAGNTWLIQPDGSKLIADDNEDQFPVQEAAVAEGLLELNALAGHAYYLDQHSLETEDWLRNNGEIKIRFLKLAVARDKRQNEILRRSQAITQADQEAGASPANHMIRERAEKEKLNTGTFEPESHTAAALLAPKKVQNLKGPWVPALGIDMATATAEVREGLKQQLLLKHKGNEHLIENASLQELNDMLEDAALELATEQLNNLRAFHGPFLEARQTKWLPAGKASILERPDQICTFDPDTGAVKEYLLHPGQIMGLVKRQRKLIPYVDPKCYQLFTHRWQIESVPPEHINKINPDCVHYLSKKQMKGLTREIFRKVCSGASSSSSSSRTINLPADKYGWLPGDLIDLIPAEFLNKVLRDQVAEIRDPRLIKELEKLGGKVEGYEPGTWTRWIDPSMVPHIDFSTQLQYLNTSAHIAQVPQEHIAALDANTQVPLISSRQAPFLSQAQVPSFPPKLVQCLQGEQLKHLTDEQYKYLRGHGQIEAIDQPDKFALLGAIADADRDLENQMQWIGEHQYAMLTEPQVQGLSNVQLLQVAEKNRATWDHISDGLTERQIRSFDSQKLVDLLSPRQIKERLQAAQVKFLKKEWQVRSSPDKYVREFDYHQVALISGEQVPHLRGKAQVNAVKEEFVPLLTAADSKDGLQVNQVKSLDESYLHLVTAAQVKGLTPSQLKYIHDHLPAEWATVQPEITAAQAAEFNTQKLFDLLTADQITRFAKEAQVPLMKAPWQVQACSLALVPHLSHEQVAHIARAQVGSLSAAQVPSCPLPLVDALSADQVQHIVEGQAPYLRGERQIQACPDDLVRHIDNTQVSLLGHWQVPFCRVGQVEHLTDDQLADITEELVPGLKGEGQIQLCPDLLTRALTIAQLPFIEAGQVPNLEGAQIAHCPAPLVKHLTPAQLVLAEEHQVPHLEGRVQVGALGSRSNMIQRLVRRQFDSMAPQQFAHLTLGQVSAFDRHSTMFFNITTQQLQAITDLAVIRNIPDGLVGNLVHAQYSQFDGSDAATIRLLTDAQVKAFNANDRALIENLGATQVPALADHLLCQLKDEKALLKAVDSKKLHHLTVRQIKTRNVAGFGNQLKYRTCGLIKTVAMPIKLIAEFICDFAKMIFALLRVTFRPKAPNKRKLKICAKRTFVVSPAVSLIAPVEFFHPAKYLKVKSKLVASAA